MLSLPSVLFFFSKVVNVDEIGIPSDVLGASLSLCGAILFKLNYSTISLLTKALFSVII